MLIIGITGTLGAGKGTIVDFLKESGFAHYSVRGFLLDEIRRSGLPQNRDSMVEVANGLRAKYSPSYITDQLYLKALKDGNNTVIESIRTPGEIESLREKGYFYLFAVDAKPEIRFKRIKLRKSETDHIDFKTFLANEKREMNSDDPNKQNLAKCREMAEFVFWNNEGIEDLFKQVKAVLKQIKIG